MVMKEMTETNETNKKSNSGKWQIEFFMIFNHENQSNFCSTCSAFFYGYLQFTNCKIKGEIENFSLIKFFVFFKDLFIQFFIIKYHQKRKQTNKNLIIIINSFENKLIFFKIVIAS